jgi:hypothetical protein
MSSLVSRAAVVVATAGLSWSSAGLAAAEHGGGGPEVSRQGHCSGSAVWKLKAKPDDGRLKIEAEVDANRNGRVWSWRILHDGYVSYRGTRITRAPSGSFTVERRVVDMSGPDSIGFRATSHASGQTCRGRVVF